jgi:hypothetical protein
LVLAPQVEMESFGDGLGGSLISGQEETQVVEQHGLPGGHP